MFTVFYIEFLVSIVVLVFLKCIFSCVLVGTSLKVILWNELKYELEKVASRKTLKELCVQEWEEKELKEENEEEELELIPRGPVDALECVCECVKNMNA